MDRTENHKIVESHLHEYCSEDEYCIFHEKESTYFHLDIYWIKSNEKRKYNILLTAGMSSLPFETPDKSLPRNIELCVLLPPDWVSNDNDWIQPEKHWPLTLLPKVARYPFQNNTWLGFSHTIETSGILHGTKFEGIMLIKSTKLTNEFQKINCGDKNIDILTILPLYREELLFARNNGSLKLLGLFDTHNINDIINVNRINVCI